MIVTIQIPLIVDGLSYDPIEYDYDTESGRCEAFIVDGTDYRFVPEIFQFWIRFLGGHQTILDKYLMKAVLDYKEARDEKRGA